MAMAKNDLSASQWNALNKIHQIKFYNLDGDNPKWVGKMRQSTIDGLLSRGLIALDVSGSRLYLTQKGKGLMLN